MACLIALFLFIGFGGVGFKKNMGSTTPSASAANP
jgi:hypothetical protein